MGEFSRTEERDTEKAGRAGCGLGFSHLDPEQRRNEAGRKEREQLEKESEEEGGVCNT